MRRKCRLKATPDMGRRQHSSVALPGTARRLAAILAVAALPLSAAGTVSAQDWLDCVMYPEQELSLGFGEAGLIDEVLVAPGQSVARGELVARQVADVERIRLDLLALRLSGDAAIAAQEARIAFIGQRLERSRLLAQRSVGTDVQLQELEYEYVIARTGLRQAEEDRAATEIEFALAEAQLERKTLKAPVDGVILELFRRPGEYAERNDSVVKLGIMDPLRARTFARIPQLGDIRPGAPVTVVPDPPFDTSLTATVSFVSIQIDPASRTFIVEAIVPNTGLSLPGGHRCRISFEPAAQ